MFLDLATLEPHEDQWDYLSTSERLTPRQVAKLAGRLREPDAGTTVDSLAPRPVHPHPAAAGPIVHLASTAGSGSAATS